MKHSPEIRLAHARRALDLAEQACPHWDCDGESEPYAHDCCRALAEARQEYRKALWAVNS